MTMLLMKMNMKKMKHSNTFKIVLRDSVFTKSTCPLYVVEGTWGHGKSGKIKRQ